MYATTYDAYNKSAYAATYEKTVAWHFSQNGLNFR